MKVLYIVTAYPRDEKDVITPWMGETIDRLRVLETINDGATVYSAESIEPAS